MIRPAAAEDRPAIWAILEPIIRAGETYALPRDMTREAALDYWLGGNHAGFVAEAEGQVAGTYFLRANQKGGGDHVANAGFAVADAFGGRGIARAMGEDALARAKRQGFIAMQFNYVVSSNAPAVGLWSSLGFAAVGRLPGAFRHPVLGAVDVLVMYRTL